MNPQVKRLFIVVIAMFLTLMFASTYIQFIGAGSLNANAYNTRSFLRAQFQQRGSIYVGEQAIAYSEADADATGARKRYHRVYADNIDLYSHLVGYLDSRGNAQGLERLENQVLMGEAPSQLLSRLKEELNGKTRQGGSVRLTLDADLQQAASDALGDRRGAVVAINYQTGAILASVSKPTYDTNLLATAAADQQETYYNQLKDDESNPLLNRAFNAEYAPGSVFKLIVAAAGISNNLRNPDSTVDAPVSILLPGTSTYLSNIDHSTCGNGKPTFTYAFANSCNTPFATLGMELGYAKLKEQAEAFGYNTEELWQTPLSVTRSVFPGLNYDQDPGLASIGIASIGQYEVRTNPLTMASVAGAIANGGVQMSPFLVAQTLNAAGEVTKDYTSGSILGYPINQDVADQILTMMQATISSGTGTYAAVSSVEMGGKTGTAQTNNDRTNAWFVGYANTDAYPLAIAVVVEGDDSTPTPHGGPVAGPVAKAVIEAAVNKNG